MPTGQPRSAAADRRSATVRAGRARVGAANQKALRGVERGDQDVPRARRMIRRHSFSGNCTARQARTPLSQRSAAADASAAHARLRLRPCPTRPAARQPASTTVRAAIGSGQGSPRGAEGQQQRELGASHPHRLPRTSCIAHRRVRSSAAARSASHQANFSRDN